MGIDMAAVRGGATERIAKILLKAAEDYIRDDQRASYPLTGDVWVKCESKRLARQFPATVAFTTADGALSIHRHDERAVKFVAHRFARETRLWNGPDVLPNDELASMFASLFHDLIWGHRFEIADEFALTIPKTMRMGNDVFILAWRFIDPSLRGRLRSYCALQAVNAAIPWYHRLKNPRK